MGELEGRVIVVTGASKPDGIGAKACQLFIEREPDCQIVVLDILEDRVQEWASAHENVTSIRTDVSNKESVVSAKNQVIERFGKVDALVCGAAYQGPGSLPLESLSAESWKACVDVNLNGTFFLLPGVRPRDARQRRLDRQHLLDGRSEPDIPFGIVQPLQGWRDHAVETACGRVGPAQGPR